jgi:hypothetical protein
MATDAATRERQRRWRWAVPALIVMAVAAVLGLRPVMADAAPALPPRTAAQLLADLPTAAQHPFSGTVQTTARLGLPDLPPTVQGQHPPLSPTDLLSGTHTLRLWYAGPDRQRVALVGDLAEANLIHNGQDVWAWNSDTLSGVHLRLPDEPPGARNDPAPLPHELLRELTPQRLAEVLLTAVEPSTKVTVDGTASVAGRAAYEIVVAPRDHRSLVHQIRLAIDAETSLPLRLQVFGTGSSDPALESAFTSIRYETPADTVFRKPSGDLKQLTPPEHVAPPSRPSLPEPRVHGSGWTTVLELPRVPHPDARTGPHALTPREQGKGDTDGGGSQPAGPPRDGTGLPPMQQGKGDTDGGGSQPNIPPPDDTITPMPGATAGSDGGGPGPADTLLTTLLRSATRVSGDYGTGRVLRTALVSVLLLDDGRVFVGAVTPATLEQAASSSPRS